MSATLPRGNGLIVTSHIYPPIPDRSHDWCAYVKGEEESSPTGYGYTEAEAVADLADQLALQWLESAVKS